MTFILSVGLALYIIDLLLIFAVTVLNGRALLNNENHRKMNFTFLYVYLLLYSWMFFVQVIPIEDITRKLSLGGCLSVVITGLIVCLKHGIDSYFDKKKTILKTFEENNIDYGDDSIDMLDTKNNTNR
ncbi:hypothetical protein MOF23_22490 [Bacillus inaquosorum]|uniref:hypothetical protein n=1 Tax=Bacillus inaquosorum TaxID=483913 RepID=UPI00228102CB|nr:hypothetical protein [Bacillus inaquosorum]MCY9311704.1 hypothetical protein [Bacillus inaquosorum]